MSIHKRTVHFSFAVSVALLSCSCKKKDRFASGEIDVVPAVNQQSKEYSSKYTLPINEKVLYFNVGGDQSPNLINSYSDADLVMRMLHAGRTLVEQNRLDEQSPFAHFTLTEKNVPVGFTFFARESTGRLDGLMTMGYTRSMDEGGDMHSLTSLVKAKLHSQPIDSIAPLLEFNELEFIDFGEESISEHVWMEIHTMSKSGKLRALVINEVESAMASRNGIIMPHIEAIVARVNSCSDIDQLGKTFPNLRLAFLSFSNRSVLADCLKRKILREQFREIRCLFLTSKGLPSWDIWVDGIALNRSLSSPIRFANVLLPEKTQWLCVDGMLLSIDEMQSYEHFAKKNRFNTNGDSIKSTIDCSFVGLGYGGSGARGLRTNELNSLHAYWTNTR